MTDTTELVHLAQITTGVQWVLRLTCLFAAGGMLVLLHLWAPMVIAAWWTVPIVLGALVSVVRPDSWVPAAMAVFVILWWQFAGGDAELWKAGILGLLLAVHHFGCVLGGLAPAWAGVASSARRRWLRAFGVYLLGCVASMGLVLLVLWLPLGPHIVWLWLAIVAIGVLVWRSVRAVAAPPA